MVGHDEILLLDETAPKHIVLPQQDGRILSVGDIHGCCDEFCELLDRYYEEGDTLICAGDLVRHTSVFINTKLT